MHTRTHTYACTHDAQSERERGRERGRERERVDAQNFFDCLMTSICEYQKKGKMYICGDFNSRYGDMLVFIVGVDVVTDRNVTDVGINKYGHLFIEFY